jgi:hypothetical protein
MELDMITTLSAPCWHRLPVNGRETVDLAEWDPHYSTRDEVFADNVEQFSGPCRVLICDGCGAEAENQETGGTIHFEPDFSDEDVIKHSEFDEHDGRVLYDDCIDKVAREELQKVGG